MANPPEECIFGMPVWNAIPDNVVISSPLAIQTLKNSLEKINTPSPFSHIKQMNTSTINMWSLYNSIEMSATESPELHQLCDSITNELKNINGEWIPLWMWDEPSSLPPGRLSRIPIHWIKKTIARKKEERTIEIPHDKYSEEKFSSVGQLILNTKSIIENETKNGNTPLLILVPKTETAFKLYTILNVFFPGEVRTYSPIPFKMCSFYWFVKTLVDIAVLDDSDFIERDTTATDLIIFLEHALKNLDFRDIREHMTKMPYLTKKKLGGIIAQYMPVSVFQLNSKMNLDDKLRILRDAIRVFLSLGSELSGDIQYQIQAFSSCLDKYIEIISKWDEPTVSGEISENISHFVNQIIADFDFFMNFVESSTRIIIASLDAMHYVLPKIEGIHVVMLWGFNEEEFLPSYNLPPFSSFKIKNILRDIQMYNLALALHNKSRVINVYYADYEHSPMDFQQIAATPQ